MWSLTAAGRNVLPYLSVTHHGGLSLSLKVLLSKCPVKVERAPQDRAGSLNEFVQSLPVSSRDADAAAHHTPKEVADAPTES